MKTNFTIVLDNCLDRVRRGETVTAVLDEYPAYAEALAPLLTSAQFLYECDPVVMPTSAELAADQQQFEDQMAQLLPLPVSNSPLMRLNDWMVTLLSWLKLNPINMKREQRKMGTLLLKATLILTILFGSVGGTAVMAAESLPDSPLYPAKMIMEEARLGLASGTTARAVLHLDLASERLREMERLMVNGTTPDGALLERAEKHIEAAFGLAAEMPAQQMAGVLVQAQTMFQTRTRAFTEIETAVPASSEQMFNQAQTMLKNAGDVVAAGLQDPQLLRHRHTTNRPEDAPEQPDMQPPAVIIITPTQTITTPVRIGPIGPCAGNEECDLQGDGPYGPGHQGPQPEQPGAGVGPGEANEDPIGPPDIPGSDHEPGNPDSGCDDCGNDTGNQYGPLPEESGNGSGQPGGSESGIPDGSQSQGGTQHQTPDDKPAPAQPPAEPSQPDSGDNGSSSNSGSGKGS
jgi:hypothetical protein